MDTKQQPSYVCTPPAPPLATPTPRLDHFIAYALHRTRLHNSVTFAMLYLLQHLKAQAMSGHVHTLGDQPDGMRDVFLPGVATQCRPVDIARLSISCLARFHQTWTLSSDGAPPPVRYHSRTRVQVTLFQHWFFHLAFAPRTSLLKDGPVIPSPSIPASGLQLPEPGKKKMDTSVDEKQAATFMRMIQRTLALVQSKDGIIPNMSCLTLPQLLQLPGMPGVPWGAFLAVFPVYVPWTMSARTTKVPDTNTNSHNPASPKRQDVLIANAAGVAYLLGEVLGNLRVVRRPCSHNDIAVTCMSCVARTTSTSPRPVHHALPAPPR
ncbi:hypothetical protein BC826DRAFT_1124626 [Russula brevipes]|nr:hypothetical protein BC826DRAFT_1124626 [Russula brevipes]